MNGFFNFRKLVVGVMAATCFMGFQSCLDDDDDYPYYRIKRLISLIDKLRKEVL